MDKFMTTSLCIPNQCPSNALPIFHQLCEASSRSLQFHMNYQNYPIENILYRQTGWKSV